MMLVLIFLALLNFQPSSGSLMDDYYRKLAREDPLFYKSGVMIPWYPENDATLGEDDRFWKWGEMIKKLEPQPIQDAKQKICGRNLILRIREVCDNKDIVPSFGIQIQCCFAGCDDNLIRFYNCAGENEHVPNFQ